MGYHIPSWRHGDRDVPVFDRGGPSINPEARIGFAGSGGQERIVLQRTPQKAPRRVLTALLLGDPSPGRAGRTPLCEDELPYDPLAPRRYRPAEKLCGAEQTRKTNA